MWKGVFLYVCVCGHAWHTCMHVCTYSWMCILSLSRCLSVSLCLSSRALSSLSVSLLSFSLSVSASLLFLSLSLLCLLQAAVILYSCQLIPTYVKAIDITAMITEILWLNDIYFWCAKIDYFSFSETVLFPSVGCDIYCYIIQVRSCVLCCNRSSGDEVILSLSLCLSHCVYMCVYVCVSPPLSLSL